MNNKEPMLVFDDSVKTKIIDALGFKKNQNCELTDKKGKIATSQDFESITYDEFWGILMGSKIPIKNKESELAKYFISEK